MTARPLSRPSAASEPALGIRHIALWMTTWLLIGAAFLGYRRTTEMPVPAIPAATTGSSPRYVTKAIQDIRPDDLVLARDQDGTKVSLKRVVETYRKTADHLRVLTFIDDREQSQTLQTTNEHPFWDAGQGAFVAASKLNIGAQVVGPTGERQRLAASRYEAHPEGVEVFNFQVEGYHTYYVAEPTSADCGDVVPVWVHNVCKTLEIHHFATNKHSRYTAEMKAIADRYGLKLNGAWNKEKLPHRGRHPHDYHEFVLDEMQQAERSAGNDVTEFLRLFEQNVKVPVRNNPDLLRKIGWQ